MATDDENDPPQATKSSGSKFMVLGRSNWDKLLKSERLDNRLNAACAYLVMLAGTGPDHSTTSWSARSFETYLGMRKANGQRAIENLCAAGLVAVEKAGNRPRYKLLNAPAKDADEADCIFLPNQLVTGIGPGPSLLRRVRETGQVNVLEMLIFLYGAVQDDITLGLDGTLQGSFAEGHEHPVGPDRKFGANNIWLLDHSTRRTCEGAWWQQFGDGLWPAIKTLEAIKAIDQQYWLFTSPESDADPLLPWDVEMMMASAAASEALCEEGYWSYISSSDSAVVVLAAHMGPPAIRSVYRPAIMADTPRRRARYHELEAIKKAAVSRWYEIAESFTNVVPFSAVKRAS